MWEPILPTDFRSPSASNLARISDQRAMQFWDPDHLIAQDLNRKAAANPSQPKPTCCVSKGFPWDEVIFYAPHTQWNNNPPSAFWNGPVVHVISSLENAFRQISSPDS